MAYESRSNPTVGSVSKKILEINPELSAQEIVYVIKQSILSEFSIEEGFLKSEVIDEEKALQMARASCRPH